MCAGTAREHMGQRATWNCISRPSAVVCRGPPMMPALHTRRLSAKRRAANRATNLAGWPDNV